MLLWGEASAEPIWGSGKGGVDGGRWGEVRQEGGEAWEGRQTFRIQFLMHILMILLKPFLAFLRRTAKLAILGWRISLCFLACNSTHDRWSVGKRGGDNMLGTEGRRSTSGGSEQTA